MDKNVYTEKICTDYLPYEFYTSLKRDLFKFYKEEELIQIHYQASDVPGPTAESINSVLNEIYLKGGIAIHTKHHTTQKAFPGNRIPEEGCIEVILLSDITPVTELTQKIASVLQQKKK